MVVDAHVCLVDHNHFLLKPASEKQAELVGTLSLVVSGLCPGLWIRICSLGVPALSVSADSAPIQSNHVAICERRHPAGNHLYVLDQMRQETLTI